LGYTEHISNFLLRLFQVIVQAETQFHYASFPAAQFVHSAYQEFFIRFYTLCKEIGLKFSIGSDAHWLHDAGNTIILAEVIKKVGITDEDIWIPRLGG
jgi:histidinol phosphatase-like PHP family hydrolase